MNRLAWDGDKVARRIGSIAPGVIRRISERIAERARQIVTVKTGKLKSSIKATDKGVVATEPYAGAVELGTATRAAKPFMRPAIERFNEQDLKQCIK